MLNSAAKAIFALYTGKKESHGAHAVLSASGAERWLGCPGSIRMSEGIKSVDTEWSKAGTNAHTLFEFMLDNPNYKELLVLPAAKKFKEMIGYTESQHASVELAAKFVRKTIEDYEVHTGNTLELNVEKRVKLRGVGFGTADVILYQPFGTLHVMDYKNGKSVVEPEGNLQMLYYACAAADEYGWDFNDVHLTILQPNAPHKRGPMRTWKTTSDVLASAQKRFRDGAAKTKLPSAPLVMDAKWCWFCPARSKCPKQMEVKEKTILERFQ
jgi:Protein of unknown function (DUF2800)